MAYVKLTSDNVISVEYHLASHDVIAIALHEYFYCNSLSFYKTNNISITIICNFVTALFLLKEDECFVVVHALLSIYNICFSHLDQKCLYELY